MSIVTDEMIEAGCAAYRRSHHGEPMPGDIEAIYLAMQMLNVRPCPNCKSKECAGTTPARDDDVDRAARAFEAEALAVAKERDGENVYLQPGIDEMEPEMRDAFYRCMGAAIAAMGDGRQG